MIRQRCDDGRVETRRTHRLSRKSNLFTESVQDRRTRVGVSRTRKHAHQMTRPHVFAELSGTESDTEALHKSFLDKYAALGGDLVPMTRALDNSAPALGDQFGLLAFAFQPVLEAAVHARNRKPRLRFLGGEQRCQFRQDEVLLWSIRCAARPRMTAWKCCWMASSVSLGTFRIFAF